MTKNGSITLDFSQFLFSASRALDAVEQEVLGATLNHAQRVAYLSSLLGRQLGMTNAERVDLAAFAALHDNALTEYITIQRRNGIKLPASQIRDDFQAHCEIGEKNVQHFPFLGGQKNVIRYHHENYDGSGFYGIRGEEIPLMARIVRMADQVDVQFNLSRYSEEKIRAVTAHLEEQKGVLYDPALIPPFLGLLTCDHLRNLNGSLIRSSLQQAVPSYEVAFTYEELIRISSVFAHIIDYKSPFTLCHSQGIAEKTKKMAEFYAFDSDTANEIYLAAYLHDIGKLAVPDALLEKPGKLTPEEFTIVKKHVWHTYEILGAVDSFSRLNRWASGHHERLDGSGYFRGNTAKDQDLCTRLLCCIDVYQALVEDRPYRKGMDPERAVQILQSQADAGKLDADIIRDIERVFLREPALL